MQSSRVVLCLLLMLVTGSLVTASTALAQTPGLSAGVTEEPTTNYSVTQKTAPDYEPPHNTRIDEPYKALVPALSPNVPVQLRPHSRLVLTDIEDRPFLTIFLGKLSLV